MMHVLSKVNIHNPTNLCLQFYGFHGCCDPALQERDYRGLSYLTSWFQSNESLGRSVAEFEDKDVRCPGDEAVGRRKLLKYKGGGAPQHI